MPSSRFSVLTVALAIFAVALLGIASWGTGAGTWPFRTGFTLLRWAAILGLAVAAAALVQLVVPRWRLSVPLLLLALLLGVAAFVTPFRWMRLARVVPPIHDITTDTADPPAFATVLPLRASAPNSAEYGGPEIAAQQRAAYPDLGPVDLAAPPADAFRRALEAARGMGWQIVAADSAAGRIEATATTRWFHFKDDVVIRIRPAAGGSRVDVRSVSRVGQSDVGTNARRIRSYLARLEPAAKARGN
ncbi:MAG: DUF1499 domain-containing protein [Gemmatimonadales bacterium]|nr:DUF1499 domain-containing protein [Gemmatimonadales bacterium]